MKILDNMGGVRWGEPKNILSDKATFRPPAFSGFAPVGDGHRPSRELNHSVDEEITGVPRCQSSQKGSSDGPWVRGKSNPPGRRWMRAGDVYQGVQ